VSINGFPGVRRNLQPSSKSVQLSKTRNSFFRVFFFLSSIVWNRKAFRMRPGIVYFRYCMRMVRTRICSTGFKSYNFFSINATFLIPVLFPPRARRQGESRPLFPPHRAKTPWPEEYRFTSPRFPNKRNYDESSCLLYINLKMQVVNRIFLPVVTFS
jgi:hypothetical protein